MGQELAWALQLRLPVLYLYPKDGQVSRQIEGSPGDLTVVAFADTSELSTPSGTSFGRTATSLPTVRAAVRSEAIKFAPLRADLSSHWHSLTQVTRSASLMRPTSTLKTSTRAPWE